MKVYCMCNRCVTLVKKQKTKKKHIQGVLVVKTCWALTLRCVSSQYERTEKHFCLMNTGFYVFLFCTYISTFVLDWNFGNKKKILAPFFISTLSSAVKTKLDLLVHFVNNQSVCVCVEIQFLRLSTFRSECHIVYRTWCRFLYTLYFLREELVLIVFTPNTAGRCQLFKHTSK